MQWCVTGKPREGAHTQQRAAEARVRVRTISAKRHVATRSSQWAKLVPVFQVFSHSENVSASFIHNVYTQSDFLFLRSSFLDSIWGFLWKGYTKAKDIFLKPSEALSFQCNLKWFYSHGKTRKWVHEHTGSFLEVRSFTLAWEWNIPWVKHQSFCESVY